MALPVEQAVRGRLPAPLRWLLLGVAGLLALLVGGSVLVMALGITVSGAPWRGQLAQAIGAAIGREVRFEGPLEMQPTLTPSFRVGGITVANPAGFEAPFFASLGDARLRVDLLALLKGEVRVKQLAATGVTVHLERNAQAQVNWLLQLAKSNEPDPKPGRKMDVRLVQIDAIDLTQIRVDYVGGPGFPRHEFFLDKLHGEAGVDSAIALDMNGTVEGRFPYSMAFRGGSLTALSRADQPWPLDFSLNFLGTTLLINGHVRPAAARTSADITVALGTEDLSQLERLLQLTLPPVGATGLSARVGWDNGVLDIRELRGVMGSTVLDGRLNVDITQAIPRVKGEFVLPVLDLTPFRAKPQAQAPPPAQKKKGEVDLEAIKRREFQFRELALVEADLALHVQRWMGLPGDVRDAALQVSLHGGVLKAPVKATVAQVPLTGEIFLDGASATPAFGLDLGVRDSALGQLGRLLTGADGVKGRLGAFSLHFAATGGNVRALSQSLEMKLRMEKAQLTYGNVEGGKPVEMRLDLLDIELPSGGRLRGEMRGALLREPFTARFKGGDLAALDTQIQWPIELSATASGATLDVRGTVAAPEKSGGTDLTLKLSSPRAGSVARWLGLSPRTRAPLALAGRVVVQSDEWRLNDLDLQLGRTRLRADLARVDLLRSPLVQAKIRLDNLELAELEAMLPPPKPGPAKPVFELPILPRGIDLTDADVDVAVKRIALNPAPVTDISFLGRIRRGQMYASPFAARYLDTQFSGALALDLRGQVPQGTVWVSAQQVDIGRLLATLGLADEMQAHTDAVVLQLDAKGHRLGEMLEGSGLLVSVEGGELQVGDPRRNPLRIALTKGQIEAKPRERVHVDLDGRIDSTPVNIRIASGSVRELLRGAQFVPFELNAEAAGTRLGLAGKVSLPISRKAVELDLSVSGDKVSSLDQLARTPLPPWGPYALRSRFRLSAAGYEMPDMTLRVASSELKGKGSVTLTGVRPRIVLQLSAPRIQLDDFKLEGWALAERKPAAESEKLSEEALRRKAREASAQTEKVLSPEALGKQDAELSVDVMEVLSGKDRLGNGSLRVRLQDGRLSLDPAEVNVPGGSAKLWLSYFPDGKNIDIESKVRVERFDYGVLARRYKPDADVQGHVSLQVDLRTRTPGLDRAMQYGNGRIDFAVWPRNMKSGIFDLWAVNLFVALVPAVDSAKESKVNCAIGRFNLKNGVLTEDSILLDTSRMRVAGRARVDFESESLSVDMAPKAKKPQFFSLATPVQVRGKLTAPKIGVSAGEVAGTAARFFASIITTPLQMLFSKEMPRDGADVCAGAAVAARAPG